MARLAVDRKRGNIRIPFLRDAVEADVDLAPVTSLAVGEAGLVAEYALATPGDVDVAVASARKALPAWSTARTLEVCVPAASAAGV